jgi:integrase
LALAPIADERAGSRQGVMYLGHANVETTMIYTHVVKELRNPARSPAHLLKDHLRQQQQK